jgi:predicted DNA-binding transcriptional regulator AlpA
VVSIKDAAQAKRPAAQVAYSKKAAVLKAENDASKAALNPALTDDSEVELTSDVARRRDQHDAESVHAARAPPTSEIRLLCKAEVVEKVGLSFPTLWSMMRKNRFPAARDLGGRPAWIASEIDSWITALPLREYKAGD